MLWALSLVRTSLGRVSERWDGTWVIYPKAHTVADTHHPRGQARLLTLHHTVLSPTTSLAMVVNHIIRPRVSPDHMNAPDMGHTLSHKMVLGTGIQDQDRHPTYIGAKQQPLLHLTNCKFTVLNMY